MKLSVNNLSLSIIICTKDRPSDVRQVIQSILHQSILPGEVLVVDSSSDKETKLLAEQLDKKVQMEFKYFHTKPSLTYQRNYGVKYSKGKIILFLDDDVILEKDYLYEILNIFTKDTNKEIYGVDGCIINESKKNFFKKLFYRLFMLTRYDGNGKMQPSGFPAYLNSNYRGNKKVDMLCGCAAYRKELFDQLKFDENLSGYATMEDDDFSYRVSRKYILIRNQKARLFHKKSSMGRPDKKNILKLRILNHEYFFRKNMNESIFQKICFIWSNIGLLIQGTVMSLKDMNLAILFTMIFAFKESLKNKVKN